jgi:hypothetical protein
MRRQRCSAASGSVASSWFCLGSGATATNHRLARFMIESGRSSSQGNSLVGTLERAAVWRTSSSYRGRQVHTQQLGKFIRSNRFLEVIALPFRAVLRLQG